MEYDSFHNYYIEMDEVRLFEMVSPQLEALRREFGELKSKKPDAVVSKTKVKLVNAVLEDALGLLGDLPESKYLARLDEDDVPQVSDVAMVLSQFHAALQRFRGLHTRNGSWFVKNDPRKEGKQS